jgi:hypothetical protein
VRGVAARVRRPGRTHRAGASLRHQSAPVGTSRLLRALEARHAAPWHRCPCASLEALSA